MIIFVALLIVGAVLGVLVGIVRMTVHSFAPPHAAAAYDRFMSKVWLWLKRVWLIYFWGMVAWIGWLIYKS